MSTTNTSPSDPPPPALQPPSCSSHPASVSISGDGPSSPTQIYTACANTEGVASFIFYSSIQKRNKTKTGWVTRTIGVTTRGEIWQLEERAKQALRAAETAKPTSTPIVPGVLTVYDSALSNATRLSGAGQAGIEASTSDLSYHPHLTGGNRLALLRIPRVDLYGSRLLLSLFSSTPRRRVCVKMIDTFMTPEFRILADHRMLKLKAETTESKAKWLEGLQICMYIQNELRSRASRLSETPVLAHHTEAFRETENESKHYDIVDDDDDDTPLDAQQLHAQELRRQTSLELTYSTGYIRPTPKSKSKKFGPIQIRNSPSKSGRKSARQLSSRKSGGEHFLGSFRNELDDLPSMSSNTSSPLSSNIPSVTSVQQKQKALTPEAHIGIRCASALTKPEREQSPHKGASDPLVLPVFRYYKVPTSRRERSCQFAGAFAMGYVITAALSMLSILLIAPTDLSLTLNSLSFISQNKLASSNSKAKVGHKDGQTGMDIHGAQFMLSRQSPVQSDYKWLLDDFSSFTQKTPSNILLPVDANGMCMKDKCEYLNPTKFSPFIVATWSHQNQVPALNVLPKINVLKARKNWSSSVQRYLKAKQQGWVWKVVGLNSWRIPKPSLTYELDRAACEENMSMLRQSTRSKRSLAVDQALKVVRIMTWIVMGVACLAVLIRGVLASLKVKSTSDTGEKFKALRDRKETSVGLIAVFAACCTIVVSLWLNIEDATAILAANLITSMACARIYCTTQLWAIPEEAIQAQNSPNTSDKVSSPTSSTSNKVMPNSNSTSLTNGVASSNAVVPREGLRLSVASSNASSIINPQTPTATMYAGTPDGASSIISQPNLTTSQERYARHFGVLKPSEPRGAVGEAPEFKNIDAVAISGGEIVQSDATNESDVDHVNVILPYPRYILNRRSELFIQKLMDKFHRLMEFADVECRPHEWRKEGVYEGIAVESHSAGPKSVSGNSALMCRGMGTVRIPPAKFMSLLWLTQHKNKYDEMCERVTTLENINNHVKIEEQEYKGYGVVSSRRMVLLAGWQRVDFGSAQHPELELSDDVMFPSTNPHAWRYDEKAILHGLFDSSKQVQRGDPAKKRFGGRARNIADAASVPNVPRNSCGHEYSADGYAMLAISIPDALYDRPANAPPIDTSLVEANLELGGFVIRGIKLPKVEKKGGGLWGGGSTKLDVAAQAVPEDQDFVWGSEVWGLGSIDLGGRIPNWIASQISRRQPLLVGRGEKYMMTTKDEGKPEVLFSTIDVDYMYA